MLDSLSSSHLNQLLVFLLVLTRFSGLALVAPVLGSRSIPMQIRALVVIGVSLLIAPLYWHVTVDQPGNLIQLLTIVGQEAVVGLTLGVGVMFLFGGLQLTGYVVGHMSGMQLADVFDPNFDASVPIFAQLLDWVALAAFLAIGGHRQVIAALLDTFVWMPPGDAGFGAELTPALTQLLQAAFVLGVRTAAPVITALLMSMLVLGLISRTLPQLNILAMGFSLNSMVMLATLAMAMGGVIYVFSEQAGLAIEHARAVFQPSATP